MEERPSLVPPSPARPRRAGWMRLALALLGALIVLAVLAGAWLYPPIHGWILARLSPPHSAIILRTAEGTASYELSGRTLAPAFPERAKTKSTFYIKESAAPLPEGTPVLGSPVAAGPSRNAMMLTRDGRLLPLALGSSLSDLTAGTNGMVAFGMRSGPVTALGASHVWAVSAAGLDLKDLGQGSDPVFAPDQSLLAFAPEGLVSLDPVTGARTVLLGAPYASSTGPELIAPSATYAVLPNAVTQVEDVYAVNPLHASSLSFIGSLPAGTALLAAFDASSFLAGPDAAHLTRYIVGKDALTPSGTYYAAR